LPEHHVLQERVVQPLQHVLHQHDSDEEGCGDLAAGPKKEIETRLIFLLALFFCIFL